MTDDLKKLALAATPGPWFVHDFTDPVINSKPSAIDVTVSCDHPATITVAAMGGGLDGHEGLEQARKDAAFIAAANPAAILALYAERDEAICDSYAEENQRLFDRAEKAEAALAAMGEREVVAYRWRCTGGDEPNRRWRLCEVLPNLDGMGPVDVQPLYASPRPEAADEAVKAERERCAKLLEDRAAELPYPGGIVVGSELMDLAAAIRSGT